MTSVNYLKHNWNVKLRETVNMAQSSKGLNNYSQVMSQPHAYSKFSFVSNYYSY